jgi:hypothetical protein
MRTNQTQTTKTNKAGQNTPVSAFESYVAKMRDKKAVAIFRELHKASQAKKATTQQAATKKGVFVLVAGTVAAIEHKMLKKAIAYHVAKGNLVKTAHGVKLTQQGATLWNAERVTPNADQFQKIAAFTHGGANMPEFGGEKKTPVKVGDNKQLPSLEYWGGFVTSNMRLAFASLWATK